MDGGEIKPSLGAKDLTRRVKLHTRLGARGGLAAPSGAGQGQGIHLQDLGQALRRHQRNLHVIRRPRLARKVTAELRGIVHDGDVGMPASAAAAGSQVGHFGRESCGAVCLCHG